MYEKLLEPGTIGRMNLRNRIVMSPTETHFTASDGMLTWPEIDYYARRAKGGVGLIITQQTQACAQLDPIDPYPRSARLDDDAYIPMMSELTEAVHLQGAKIAVLLTPGGGAQAMGSPYEPGRFGIDEPMNVGPSEIRCPVADRPVRRLSVEEIHQFVRTYGQSALRAKKAGFDAVAIHAHAGYLISQFLSPFFNNRDDEYGGSLANRARFLLELVAEVRRVNGPMMPIIVRLSADDGIGEKGRQIKDTVELAKMLHLTVIPIEGDGYGMLPEALERACKDHSVRGVYLMPTCQMPTTFLMDEARREQLAQVARAHDLLILEDDIYAFLAPDGVRPLVALAPERTVHICSLSKSLAAGLRVAFLAYPPRCAEAMVRGIYNVNVKTPSFNTEVACTLIRSGMAEEIVKQKMALAEERNAICDRYFPRNTGGNEHPLSFCRWVPLNGRRGLAIEDEALQNGVRVFHSDRFLSGLPEGQEYLRIALSSPTDSTKLEQGLTLLKEVVDRPRPAANSPVI